jgi:hypothetical protein
MRGCGSDDGPTVFDDGSADSLWKVEKRPPELVLLGAFAVAHRGVSGDEPEVF